MFVKGQSRRERLPTRGAKPTQILQEIDKHLVISGCLNKGSNRLCQLPGSV